MVSVLVLDGSGYLGEGVGRYIDGVLSDDQRLGKFFRTWQRLSRGKAYRMDDGDW